MERAERSRQLLAVSRGSCCGFGRVLGNLRCRTWVFLLLLSVSPSEIRGAETLIDFGDTASWKYLDTSEVAPQGWQAAGFDDSRWPTGRAPLGYGDAVQTEIAYGGNPAKKHVTAYLRRTFSVRDPRELRELQFSIRGDDGFVLYLNGQEAIRFNLPESSISASTTATRRIDDVQELLYRPFTATASRLLPGENLIAVELHQFSRSSTDLGLDLALRASRRDGGTPGMVRPEARQITQRYREKHHLDPAAVIPDGFVDGGREMVLDDQGRATSARELLIVDRSRDRLLQAHIAFARTAALRWSDPQERVKRLCDYVGLVMSPRDPWSEAAVELMADAYAGREVLLGDVPRLCGAGVCRHCALLLKVMAQEAGVPMALRRGNLKEGGAHAWNELRSGKDIRVVDILNPQLPAQSYLTVDNQPIYRVGPLPGSPSELQREGAWNR